MLNFKESVAKVKSAPNFGKVTKTSMQTSKSAKYKFFFVFFCWIFGVYTGRGIYPRRMRNTPDNRDMSDTLWHLGGRFRKLLTCKYIYLCVTRFGMDHLNSKIGAV